MGSSGVFLVLAVCSAFLGMADSLSCYACYYDPFIAATGSASCGANFNSSGVTPTECSASVTGCVTVRSEGYGNVAFHRGCGDPLCQEGCLEGAGIKSCYECCYTDNCNTGQGSSKGSYVAPSILTIILTMGALLTNNGFRV